jgi:hypothetical protein
MSTRFGSAALYIIFLSFLVLNIAFWLQTKSMRPIWGNVPPVPSQNNAAGMALGDAQFAYRLTGLMLQNIGNATDSTKPLSEYNYDTLKGWLFLADHLDPNSNFVPSLAAYYYGATQDKSDLTPIIDYLEVIGQRPEPQKWRWLAQAVYLARFEQNDLQRALDLANKLANLPRDDLPLWARQMPALVMNAGGQKEAAYAVMMSTLTSEIDNLSPPEILFLRNYICDRILTPVQAAQNDLCTKTR